MFQVLTLGTTGLEPDCDLITEVSLLRYVDERLDVPESFSRFLDWSQESCVAADEYAALLDDARRYAEEIRAPFEHLSIEGLRRDGVAAPLVLSAVLQRLLAEPTVLFNCNFVLSMFAANANRVGFEVTLDELLARMSWLDVMLVERGSLLEMSPWPGDSLAQFQERIAGTPARGTVSVSLDAVRQFYGVRVDGGDRRFASQQKAAAIAGVYRAHLDCLIESEADS